MHQLFIDIAERLTFLHNEVHTELDRLPDEAFDWTPAEDMTSIAVLVIHLLGAEQYWTCHMAAGNDSDRVRSLEFEVKGLTRVALKAHLDAGLAAVEAALSTLSIEDLTVMRTSPLADTPRAVSWCLQHAVEHTATHVGHIQMMRHYWQHVHAPANS